MFSWRGCGEKGTLLHFCWECILIQPLWKTVWRFLKKLGIKPPFYSTIGEGTHSSILAWRIPWTEESCRLQSMGSQDQDMTEWLSLLLLNNTISRHIPRGNQNWKIHMYLSVRCRAVYNSWVMGATKMSINRWMDKETMVHIYNGILLSYKKNAFELVLMRWIHLEPIIQSEVSQQEKNKYHILMHIYGI